MAALSVSACVRSSPDGTAAGLSTIFDLDKSEPVTAVQGGTLVVSSGGSPVALQFGTITAAQLVAVKLISGSFTFRLTTAAGAAQSLPLGDMIVWMATASGDEATAAEVQGTGTLEYLVGGD